jgi:hypothetical protein
LVHIDHELIAEAAGQDLVGRLLDGVGDLRVEPAERRVGGGGRLLDEDGGADELGRGVQAADGKVSTARAVCTPQYASAGT